MGPVRATGNLDITGDGVAELNSTLYVQGDLRVTGQSIIKLNKQTIYAEGTITFQPGSGLYGPGCIIAVGNVNFSPNIYSGEGDFILLMSVNGIVNSQPGNVFYGSMGAGGDVVLQPDCEIRWVPLPAWLDYPQGGAGADSYVSLETITYNIN